ncbi:MAG: VCBS domain-containing protein [Alphaproteobacteria bacterium]|nr:VCBS domain-containing protein [Alphaproteobacteria bacterium]
MTIRIVIFRDEQQMVFEGARARRVRLQTGDKVLFEGTDLQKADFRLEGRDLMVEVEGEGQFVLEGFYDREQGRTVAELVLDEETLGQILGALQPAAGETAQTEGPENEHHFRIGFTGVRRYDAAGIDGVGQEGVGEIGDRIGLGAPSAGVSVVSILTDVPSIYGGNGPTGPITGGTNAPVGVDDVVGPIDENATVSRNTRASGVLGNDTDADPTQQVFLTVSQVLASTPDATAVAVAGSGATTLEGAYGTLTIRANGTYAYSADADAADRLAQGASAQEVFTYTVRDADGRTATATLTIRINGVNDAPTAVNDAASVDEGGSVTGDVILGAAGGAGRDSDAEGDALTVTGIRAGAAGGFTAVAAGGSQVVTSGAGSLTINSDGTYSYSYGDDPALAAGQTRIQTFSYQVSDGRATSVATLSITIRGGDGATAVNDTVTADEDSGTPAIGDVLANDIDRGNGPLVVVGVGNDAVPAGGEQILDGQYGALTIRSDGTYTYNPDDARDDAAPQGGSVLDTFRYTIRDALGRTSTGTLSVQVRGANDDPTAVDDQASVNENATVSGGTRATGLLGNDTDPDNGETASLVVASVDDAAGGSVAVPGTGNVVVTGAFGSLTIAANGTYTYAANGAAAEALPQGETALDTFTYTIRDAQGATSQATFTVTVTGQNDAPVAANDANAVDEGTSVLGDVVQGDIDGNGADTDVDGDTLAVTGIRAGTTGGFTAVAEGGSQVVNVGAGSLTMNSDGTYSYSYGDDPTLGDGQTLNQVFTYQVSDGTVSRTANLTITVRGNSGPVGTPDVENAQEDTGATINGNVLTNDIDRLDPANPRLQVTAVNGQAGNVSQQIAGQFGSLLLNADGTYTYILDDTRDDAAPQGGVLNDVFTYTLRDLNNRSSLGTLTIRVQGVNDDPTAVDDTVGVNENATVNRGTRATGLLGNDTDPDNGETASLVVASVDDAAGGSVVVPGTGNVVVTGAFGSLTIAANGNDTLIGGAGQDTFVGFAGNDYASYITSSSNVSINFVTGLFTNDAQNDLFHFTIEVLQLTNQSDLITLNSSRSWEIRSEGGNDTINSEGAGTQINRLLGGAGDDLIRINANTGLLGIFSGELGNDTLQLGSGVDVNLATGNESRMTGFEVIDLNYAGAHTVRLNANNLANNLTSGTLRIMGSTDDRVELSFGLTGWTSVNNGSTTTYTSRDNGRSVEIDNSVVMQIV